MQLRIRAIFVIALLLLIQIIPVAATANNCPETWNIKSPRLAITTENKDIVLAGSAVKAATLYVSTITVINGGTSGWVYDTKNEVIRKLRPIIEQNFGPEFLARLDSSPSQITFKDGIVGAEETSLNDESKITSAFLREVPDRFTPYSLVRLGNIYSGSQVKYLMELTVRDCAPFLISSNVTTVPKTDLEEIGWSRWMKETEIWLKTNYEQKGQTVNWIAWDKNVSLFRKGLEEIKKGSPKIPFGWNKELYSKSDFSPVAADNFAIPSIHGFSPVGCANSNSYSQLPFGLTIVEVPCKIVIASTFTGYNFSETAPSPFIEKFEISIVKTKVPARETEAPKKTTITCVKGKLIKKVTAIKPKCPMGYKKK